MDNLGVYTLVSICIVIVIFKLATSQNRDFKSEGKSKKEIYHKYLKSNKWLKKKRRALKRAGYKCQVCGYNKNLQVHHNTYERIYHEHKQDLVVLCWKCHAIFHKK